jgi:hypothetical protein
LYAGKHVLHCFGESLGFARESIGDGKYSDAARGEMRTPILKGAARAGDPAAAMHGDQRRRSFGRFRQIKVADKLDAIMIGIGDAVFDRNAVRHFLVSCCTPHAMANRICRGRTTRQDCKVTEK